MAGFVQALEFQNDKRIVCSEVIERATQPRAIGDLHPRGPIGKYPSASRLSQLAGLAAANAWDPNMQS